MHLDRGRVERERLDLDAHDLLLLQALEDAVEHPLLRPPVHPGVDRVPIAEALRKPAPLASMLGHKQQGIQHLEVVGLYIPALPRKAVLDPGVLLLGDFHLLRDYMLDMSLVLTRPSRKTRGLDVVFISSLPSG